MLGFDGYDEAIDIWSIGCILGELLNGRPIFQGREYVLLHFIRFVIDVICSYVDQLKCIFEYLGSPDEEIIKRIARGRVRFSPPLSQNHN
jgi:serine/threonine protein kinase